MVFFLRRAAVKKCTGKVVVFGATSVVGQPLSLLLTLCPHVSEVFCCGTLNKAKDETVRTPAHGVAVDLSHIDVNAVVNGIDDPSHWEMALRGAQLVLVCSGNEFDPSRARRDIALSESAPEVIVAMEAVARAAPKAVIGVVSSPVNALVPLAKEVLVRHGVFDPRKLFGITTLDVVRARTLVAQELQMNPYDVNIPVVGGRGGLTACALVAQTGLRIPHERLMHLSEKLQSYGSSVPDKNSNDTILEEREKMEDTDNNSFDLDVAPPVGLSLAYAAMEWSVSVLKAMRGDRGIIECSYLESTMRKETPFFSSRVELGEEGVSQLLPLEPLTSYETALVEAAVPLIVEDVEAGVRFASMKGKEE
ncbi:putative malate dehydrogenase [Trypanosoma theileri]|uniref:Malate dehydrogenase n=1 Tax=Trypanosoma theileri TaxID=67003 RepID=A0A1X0P9G5_9TRYP|nr:putative malate dehydrogenase [Trypanosoma theileri]ORC93239.1 putative malate dehydrogenase [Trypanosoma theileri]